MPTLQELKAQQAEIARQMAEYEKPLIESARDALADTAGLQQSLGAVYADLPDGQTKVQVGNVLTVLTAVPQVLADELARVNALIAAPPAE